MKKVFVYKTMMAAAICWGVLCQQLHSDWTSFRAGGGSRVEGTLPVSWGPHLFLNIEHRGPSYLMAIDKTSGEIAWKVERGSGSSWASPIVAKLNDAEQVIVSSGGSVTGYNAKDGGLDAAELKAMVESFAARRADSQSSARDPIVYGAAASDGKIVIRTGTRLYCIQ